MRPDVFPSSKSDTAAQHRPHVTSRLEGTDQLQTWSHSCPLLWLGLGWTLSFKRCYLQRCGRGLKKPQRMAQYPRAGDVFGQLSRLRRQGREPPLRKGQPTAAKAFRVSSEPTDGDRAGKEPGRDPNPQPCSPSARGSPTVRTLDKLSSENPCRAAQPPRGSLVALSQLPSKTRMGRGG